MKIVVDMNLSPAWVEYLQSNGIAAERWSTLGNARASIGAIREHRAFLVRGALVTIEPHKLRARVLPIGKPI